MAFLFFSSTRRLERVSDLPLPRSAGASTALGENIMGGFGNRHRASEVDIPDAPDTWAQCPDYECVPCTGYKPRDVCPHNNFTGVHDIICGYKYELCEQLRLEHRACRKARGRMCKPVGKKTRTVCTREVSREWGEKCAGDAAKIDSGLADLRDQLAALKKLQRSMDNGGDDCGCAAPSATEPVTADSFTCGSDGEVTLKSDSDGGGWFESGKTQKQKREERRRARAGKKNKLSDVQSSLSKIRDTASELLGDDGGVSSADLTVDLGGLTAAMDELEDSIAALEELIAKLEAKRKQNANLCDPDRQDAGMQKNVLNHCHEVEENDKMFERHEEKCARRTAEALAQSAKLQALIDESRRRLSLLNGLDDVNDGVTSAYTDINLTAPAFAILGTSFIDPEFSSKTRNMMESMLVNETSLCAEVLPTLQFSIQGLGISKEEVWCPSPTGTFIGGRDLPDWAPHFLVGVGLVIGLLISAFAKLTPLIYEWMCEHPLACLMGAVAVLAGKFTS